MDCIFEFILPLFGEALLGALIEGAAEGIGRLVAWIYRTLTGRVDDPRRPPDDLRVGRAILYQLMGLAAGAVSLLVFREHMIKFPAIRVVNLIVTPFAMAAVTVQWARFLARHRRHPTPLNHFACAYGFALCYLLVRYFFGRDLPTP